MTSLSTTVRLACASLAVSAAALPAAATADTPAAGCPTPYILFQIPTDGSRPVATALDAQGNGDGYACEMPHPGASAEHLGAPYNVIDNRVQASP
jgi:hypothetical protein